MIPQRIFRWIVFALISLSLGPLAAHMNSPLFSFPKERRCVTYRLRQQVASCGAPTTGWLIEGRVGSFRREGRRRFYCYSANHQEGFLGPQAAAKPVSLRDQPGVFPAPIVGPASLMFSFREVNPDGTLIPVIVKPDGTILRGQPITTSNSPQILVVSAPAQTGIYNLFILAQRQQAGEAEVFVEASVSTQPTQMQMLMLKPFDANSLDPTCVNAEFLYIGR